MTAQTVTDLLADIEPVVRGWIAEQIGDNANSNIPGDQFEFEFTNLAAGDTLYYDGSSFEWRNNSLLQIDPANSIVTVSSGVLYVDDGNAVAASLKTSDYSIISAEGTAPGLSIVSAGAAQQDRGVIKGVRSDGTVGTPTVPSDNDWVFSILGAIFDGVDTEGTAQINFIVDGAVSENVAPQRISFWTSATNAAARAERMRINSDGTVVVLGVDTKLIVTGSTAAAIQLEDSGFANDPTFEWQSLSGNLRLNYSDDAPTATTDILTIDSSGVFHTALTIDGGADEIQLRIQADAGQSTNIITWEKSDATVWGGVDERGILFSHGGIDADSVYIGSDAGNISHTNAVRNIGIGTSALATLTTGDNNAMLGYQAGNLITTGASNTGIGSGALGALVGGSSNMGVGTDALRDNVSGSDNVAMGQAALADTTASLNTAVGSQAGRLNVGGLYNVFIGANAGYNNSSASGNVAIGYFAGRYYTTGASNVAVGREALEGVSGNVFDSNTAIGYKAGTGQTTGDDNVYIGENAGPAVTTATRSVFIGRRSGFANTEGHSNVLVGQSAGYQNVTGDNNVAIGNVSGYGVAANSYSNNTMVGAGTGQLLTTGSNNILIGFQAGNVLTTGASNIIIGYDIDPSAAGASNEINIGGVYKGNVDTPVFTLPVAGTIGDGGATNYANFAADGELTLFGTARVMRCMHFEPTVTRLPGANPPAEDNIDNFAFHRYDRGTIESVYVHWEIPHNYAAAGTVHLHFEFLVENPPVGDDEAVVMGVEYKKVSTGDVFDFDAGTASGTVTETIVDGETAYITHMTGEINLTTTGWAPMDVILFRFYRDATNVADTYDNEGAPAANDAWVYSYHLEWLSDKLGTAT